MTDDLPRTIENPLTGERVTFLATTDETDGAYVRIRNEVSAGAPGVVLHYHLTYSETFRVLEGRLDVSVGDNPNHVVLAAGSSAFVPVRTAHRWWNASSEPAVFEVEVRPARNFERALRAQFGLVAEGRTNRRAIPKNVLELALIYVLAESYIAGVPLVLQRGISRLLAAVARRIGHDPELSRYIRAGGVGA